MESSTFRDLIICGIVGYIFGSILGGILIATGVVDRFFDWLNR